ncbi:MAG: AMP-binding protein, partial [Betaproteobacteria bacterium]
MFQALKPLLAVGAADAPALGTPGRRALSFGELRALIGRTLAALHGVGIGRNDAVAIVLPNGPEMAACYMACASGVTSAPLNPAYRADEFEFYLADLQARALIVERGSASPAVEVARKLGVRLIELVPRAEGGAGDFDLDLPAGTPAAQGGDALPGDVSM